MPELVKNQIDFIKENEISLSMKETKNEYTARIRILIGIDIQFASKQQYTRNIENRAAIENGIIELKQDKIYEKGYSSIYYVVYAVLSEYEDIDNILQALSFG